MDFGVLGDHFAPSDGCAESVGQFEFGLQGLVDVADDVFDDGFWSVKDAALELSFWIVVVEEVFAEVKRGVLLAPAKVSEDCLQVGLRALEEFDDVLDAELVKIEVAVVAVGVQECGQHLSQEGIGDGG